MKPKQSVWIFLVLLFSTFPAVAKPPGTTAAAAVAAPVVYSVKIDYSNSQFVIDGVDLDVASASATIAGEPLTLEPAPVSTDTHLVFSYSTDVAAVVDSAGNYVVVVTTAGGSFALSAFIPFGLVYSPPSGDPCPCQGEWDYFSSTPSPNGYAGQTPYCSQDAADFVTVQFYDQPVGNYWVLWTDWNAGTSVGMCEQFMDGPQRSLNTEAEFNACAGYLRNIITVWGPGTNSCLY